MPWRVRKYHTGYVLDHPMECGLIFQQHDSKQCLKVKDKTKKRERKMGIYEELQKLD